VQLKRWQDVGCHSCTWSRLGSKTTRDDKGPKDWHQGKEMSGELARGPSGRLLKFKTHGSLHGRLPPEGRQRRWSSLTWTQPSWQQNLLSYLPFWKNELWTMFIFPSSDKSVSSILGLNWDWAAWEVIRSRIRAHANLSYFSLYRNAIG
jgi:hypothetical protein